MRKIYHVWKILHPVGLMSQNCHDFHYSTTPIENRDWSSKWSSKWPRKVEIDQCQERFSDNSLKITASLYCANVLTAS